MRLFDHAVVRHMMQQARDNFVGPSETVRLISYAWSQVPGKFAVTAFNEAENIVDGDSIRGASTLLNKFFRRKLVSNTIADFSSF